MIFPAIDHVALVVADLERAVAQLRGLGFSVEHGGTHPNGSHNAFASFADGSALELFGFQDRSQANAHRYWQRLQRGEGLAEVCLEGTDLDLATAAYRSGGVELEAPVQRSRTRPDGVVLHWEVALVAPPLRGVIPFVIHDVTPRSARIPPPGVHRNGCRGVEAVEILVNRLEPARRWAAAVARQETAGLVEDAAGLELALGGQRLRWRAPLPGSPEQAWLASHGEGPWALRLKLPPGTALPAEPVLGAQLHAAAQRT